MTAVLLLVFRDTILSLVASVQITGNDMVRVGDWIEMPQFGADGDVIDVALHTVKVQNWDKTVTTIPTHRLITDSFKNWRFMSLSGGRRIKRSLSIDMGTVRFLTDDEVAHVGHFALMREYIAEKRKELEANHAREGLNPEYGADVRRLTNLGTFRAYIERYLEAHPRIHSNGMTLLVRQLAPTELGIPIELYCFTTTTDWNAYEAIQADIFDHLLAVAPEFGLAAFQSPSGSDFAELIGGQG
jgi:miniconductance mechanosensitive channel